MTQILFDMDSDAQLGWHRDRPKRGRLVLMNRHTPGWIRLAVTGKPAARMRRQSTHAS